MLNISTTVSSDSHSFINRSGEQGLWLLLKNVVNKHVHHRSSSPSSGSLLFQNLLTKLLLTNISINFFSPNNLWTLSSSLRAKSERWKDGTVRVDDVKHSWAHPNKTVLFCYNTLDNKGEKVRHCSHNYIFHGCSAALTSAAPSFCQLPGISHVVSTFYHTFGWISGD